MRELYERLAGEVGKVVVGQDEACAACSPASRSAATCCSRACPGVAKTLLASAVARALGLDFRRVQFTPDMLPVGRHRAR